MRTTRRVTGANSRLLIGRALAWLRARGWSAGETLDTSARPQRWKVDATHHSGQSISASAATRSGAWDVACRRVGRLPPSR